MSDIIFYWILEIPQALCSVADFLVTPINTHFLNVTPLELLGTGSISVLFIILGVHVVRLFTL